MKKVYQIGPQKAIISMFLCLYIFNPQKRFELFERGLSMAGLFSPSKTGHQLWSAFNKIRTIATAPLPGPER